LKSTERSSSQLVLVDFDGTLIQGDSTKLAYRAAYSSTISFLISYYTSHVLGLILLIFTGKDDYLRESRRVVLVAKFDEIKRSNFIVEAQKRMFEQVYSRAISYVNNGYGLVIISAGYSEIIRLIIGDNLTYELIANSLFDKEPEVINYENKIKRLNLKVKSTYFIKAAYGNTKGDIPMLQLAEKAFWVDENGRISEFLD
jgi:phosphoserine phosphatase